jgi:hypothetical protein
MTGIHRYTANEQILQDLNQELMNVTMSFKTSPTLPCAVIQSEKELSSKIDQALQHNNNCFVTLTVGGIKQKFLSFVYDIHNHEIPPLNSKRNKRMLMISERYIIDGEPVYKLFRYEAIDLASFAFAGENKSRIVRVFFSMTILFHPCEALDKKYILLKILMTLCKDARLEFVIMDLDTNQIVICNKATMKLFSSNTGHKLTQDEIKKYDSELKHYFNRCDLAYKRERMLPKDTENYADRHNAVQCTVQQLEQAELKWKPILTLFNKVDDPLESNTRNISNLVSAQIAIPVHLTRSRTSGNISISAPLAVSNNRTDETVVTSNISNLLVDKVKIKVKAVSKKAKKVVRKTKATSNKKKLTKLRSKSKHKLATKNYRNDKEQNILKEVHIII